MSKKIVISAKFFNWGGGVDLIHSFTKALLAVEGKHDIEIYLAVPDSDNIFYKTIKYIKSFLKVPIYLIKDKKITYEKPNFFNREMVLSTFSDVNDSIKVVRHQNSNEGFKTCLKDICADVVLPVSESLGYNFPTPWIGYIPDFQHKYYPQFFNSKEICRRDVYFKKLVDDAKILVVNAKSVKDDIFKFYPDTKVKIFNLSFAPILDSRWLEGMPEERLKAKYSLPDRYFLISNQFWIHKSHITAFEALSILKNKYDIDDIHIVCTGETYDYRFPNYFNELKEQIKALNITEKVHFLGFINKNEQINIMRNSIAVLQPTLFEGGPGGGAVYNAVALGIPCIVSDIEVNKEIKADNVLFFEKQSPEKMAIRMNEVLKEDAVRYSDDELIEKSRQRIQQLGLELMEAINYLD